MKIGIIGLPKSGKTTVFYVLTRRIAEGSNQSNKGPHLRFGNIKVPDERLDKIASIVNPKKIIKSEITFVDETESVRDKYRCFSPVHIREVDALVDVIRLFKNEDVMHPLGDIDPVRDLEQLEAELILSDLEVVERRLDKIEKELKGGRKEHERELNILKRCKGALENEEALRGIEFDKQQEDVLRGFGFLSQKPLMILANVDEEGIALSLPEGLRDIAERKNLTTIKFCAKLEAEILELDESEQDKFLKELGIKESAYNKFIQAAYSMLNLISFFTVKNDILKSWTVAQNTPANEAAGKIHTDIKRGFIKAEVVSFDDFIKYGGFAECRKRGLVHLEGKDYIIEDGDIIDFKFNV